MKADLLRQMTEMKDFFDRSSRVLTEADSQFAPNPELYTVAGQVAHVAQVFDWFRQGAFAPEGFAMDFDRQIAEVRAVTSLQAARDWLDRAVADLRSTIESKTEEDWRAPIADGPIMAGLPRTHIFEALIDHTAHHRGVLTVYSRLLGKVPPMPYMEE